MSFAALVMAHAAVTWFLCGLIWLVQVVHYALYPLVGADHFVAYEREHCRRIAPVVLPAMLLELGLTIALVVLAPDAQRLAWAVAGAVLLLVVWLSTFLVQVPCHRVLEQTADAPAMRRLVRSNWIRTVAWSARGVTALGLLWLELG